MLFGYHFRVYEYGKGTFFFLNKNYAHEKGIIILDILEVLKQAFGRYL